MRAYGRLSLAFVRRRATANMGSTCKIERVNPPIFDETDLSADAGSRTTVYTGVCRIWEATSSGVVMVGEEEIPIQTTQLSIPWDTESTPQRDDEVEILTSYTDDQLVGRRFRILDVAKAGDLRPSRRFTVQSITESGDWP